MSSMKGNIAEGYINFNSVLQVADIKADCYYSLMEIKEIRRKNLEKLVDREGRQAGLARKVELAPAYIHQMLAGKSMGDKTARKIEIALKLPVGWMDVWSPEEEEGAPLSTPRYRLPTKEIPVVGTTQGGPDRHWEEMGFPTGWGDEYGVIESDDPHAYLLRVEGDSMSPRINPGEYVLVEPSLEAQPGDIVVAKLTNGEVMLKYFRADYGDEISLESHNHGFTLRTVKKTDMVYIHHVSAIVFRRKIKKRV